MPRTGAGPGSGVGLFSPPPTPSGPSWVLTLGSVLGAFVTLVFAFALIPGEPIPWLGLGALGVLALVARWLFYRQN